MSGAANEQLREAIADGTMSGRLWFYTNYHCNLTCTYCLTESSPTAEARRLSEDCILELAEGAAELGFTEFAVTGGEPFLERHLPETLARLAALRPTIVLTNGTLFGPALIERLRPAAGLPLKVQISLDSAAAAVNDSFRGEGNFERVLETIPRLLELDLGVRVATTSEELGDEELEAICELHRSLGIGDEDHVTRPVIRRGRAIDFELGFVPAFEQFPPELTITADGAFWSPASPTVFRGRLDIDLLLTRTVSPLSKPALAMLGQLAGRPLGVAEGIT